MVVIAKNEILRHVKTKRFMGLALIVVASAILVFCVPLLSGDSYSGQTTEELYPAPLDSEMYPDYHSYAWLSHGDARAESIKILVNDTYLSANEWEFQTDLGAIVFFRTDYNSTSVTVSYQYAMNEIALAKDMLVPFPFIIGFCASVLGADAIVGDIQTRTAYLLFPNAIRRSSILYGKVLADTIVGVVILSLFFFTVALLSFIAVGVVARFLYVPLVFALLYLFMCLMMSFAISTVSRTTVEALATSLLLLLLVFPSLQAAEASAGQDSWYVPTFAADAIVQSISWNDYPQDVTENTSVPTYYPDPGLSFAVLTIYSAISVAASVVLFGRRELT